MSSGALRAAWHLYKTDKRRDTLLALFIGAVALVPVLLRLRRVLASR